MTDTGSCDRSFGVAQAVALNVIWHNLPFLLQIFYNTLSYPAVKFTEIIAYLNIQLLNTISVMCKHKGEIKGKSFIEI